MARNSTKATRQTARAKRQDSSQPAAPKDPVLPRRAIQQVHLGQSFAEYDSTLTNPSVYVHTPALDAASSFSNPHCFFVGRRGTGKTTITKYLSVVRENILLVRPELFSPTLARFAIEDLKDAKQKPFRSLTAAFRRSLQNEVLLAWVNDYRAYNSSLPTDLAEELDQMEDFDFDLRVLSYIEDLTGSLVLADESSWLRAIKRPKLVSKSMNYVGVGDQSQYSLLIDAIDDSWDGSELAVVYLAALMHACLEINSQLDGMRVVVFVRENIFERVRVLDTEFSRLETCVVGLDWTREQLLEMVERRLNAPLTTKYALGGQTWDLFFEDGSEARHLVFDFCQARPRDILTYVGLALDTAQSHKHEKILTRDLLDARRRFSDSRLKDLGDEYQENYPQLSLVLSKFYSLGQRWTLTGISALLERLLLDEQVKKSCASWIYNHSTPELLVRMLYNIGFVGLTDSSRGRLAEPEPVSYRSLGPRDTTAPALTISSEVHVHPSYWDALELQDRTVDEFSSAESFRQVGELIELPAAIEFEQYQLDLQATLDSLKSLPQGRDDASKFEDLVGQVLRLCFFRVLANIEAQERNVGNSVRRDWVASNRADTGFWGMVKNRYQATQVIFECKNFEALGSSDFQQATYYMTNHAGRLVFLVYRGDLNPHYYEHIRRASAKEDGLILLLNDKDLLVFLRQALNGKVKEDHLLERHDATTRAIS